MPRKPLVDELKLGVFVLIVLAMLAYLSLKIGGVGAGETIRAFVFFDDAAGLVKDAAVNIAGVRVGTVRALDVAGRRARITFTLTPDAQVRQDAVATIRAKSLLGEKYLEIIPQSETAPLLKSGDTISRVIETTDVDQIITKMRPVLDTIVGDGQKPGMLEDVAALTKMLRTSVGEVQSAMPELVRNLRDLTAELKTMATENRQKLAQTTDAVERMTQTAARLLDQNAQKISDTVEAANRLARSSAALVTKHEKQIGRTVENTDKVVAAFAEHSQEIAKNLAIISANVAAASAKFPQLTEAAARLSAKLDVTLDISNRLLARVEGIDLMLVRKILQEEGIKITFSTRKVTEPKPQPSAGKEEAKPKEGFLWFGKEEKKP